MTISTTESEIAYNGNGITTVFSFPYRFLANGDIVVVGVSSTGVSTTKVLTTDYTLTGAGDDAGGTVTMLVAPAVGTRLIIYRDTEIVQETDFISGDPFPAETHERALDRLTMIAQEIIPQSTRSIRVPVGDPVSLNPTLPAAVDRLDKFIVFDATTGATELSTVTQTQVASAVTAAYAAGTTADAITFLPEGVGAVSRSVQSKLRESVSVTDFGASTGATAAANVIAFQAALTKGGRVYVPAGTYLLNAELTVSVANTEVILDDGAILSWSTLGANKAGFKITVDYFSITGGKLQGPIAVADVSNEAAIWMVGTSRTARKTGLTVRGVEITGFGQYGIYTNFASSILIENCVVHDTRMHGICHLSSNDIRETGNWIYDIALGDNLNAYGFIHSHDATDYDLDAAAATNGRVTVNPFCIGVYCVGNTVENIGWEGIDCHGAYDTTIAFNRVYNTKLGISAPSSSNDGANYAGEQNVIHGNLVTAYKRDGTAGSYANLGYGINLNGGSVVNNRRVVCSDNILVGKGEISVSGGGAIRAIYCMHVSISGNEIHDWGGQCIYTLDTFGIINGNIFGGMTSSGDTEGQCIRIDGTTDKLTISDNKHWYADKSRAAEGLRVNAGNTSRQVLCGNDFGEATVPYSLNSAQVLGTDVLPSLTNSDGTAEIDVAVLQGWDAVVYLSSNSTYNVDDIINSRHGQQLTFINTGSGTVTFVRTGSPGMFLDGGTTKALATGGKNNITIRNLNSLLTQVGYSVSS